MHRSLTTRFFREFLKEFGKTMREDKFDRAVIAAALLYFLVSGLFWERWEFVATVALALCLIAVYHAFKAAASLKREITAEVVEQSQASKSLLFDAYNKPLIIAPLVSAPSFYAIKLYSIACVFLVPFGYIGFSVLQHRLETDPRPMFIRECDRPLLGIYAIATLNKEITRKDLGKFGFNVELSDVDVNPERAGLFLSAFPTTEDLPTLRPPFKGPAVQGMQCAVWSSPSRPANDQTPPSFSVLSNIFVFGYESLDRIETGGRISNSPFQTLGDLDHAFIQIVASTALANTIRRIHLVANDYVIYSISGSDLSWEPINACDASWVLPIQLKCIALAKAKLPLVAMKLNFENIKGKKHRILYSGMTWKDLVGVTVLHEHGDQGWLPKDY